MSIELLIALNSIGIFGALAGIGRLLYCTGRFTQRFDDHCKQDELIMKGINARLNKIESKI